MYDNFFSSRLASLRSEKGISARDMSLSIGQNPGYINYIENGKALPSMSGFFYICEYLDISPSEFFDGENKAPEEIRLLMQDLKNFLQKSWNLSPFWYKRWQKKSKEHLQHLTASSAPFFIYFSYSYK